VKQIQPHYLWLGHAGDGGDWRPVFDAGIRAVVQLAAEEPPWQPPRELISCRFPLLDSPGNDPKLLRLAITTVAQLLKAHVPTLVACGAGQSRAAAVAAAALAVLGREKPEECLQQIVAHTPADVVPGLWAEVKGVLEADRS
jgi:protein-tyrosine phosphatase